MTSVFNGREKALYRVEFASGNLVMSTDDLKKAEDLVRENPQLKLFDVHWGETIQVEGINAEESTSGISSQRDP